MDIEGKTLVAYRRLFDDALFAAMENVRRNEKNPGRAAALLVEKQKCWDCRAMSSVVISFMSYARGKRLFPMPLKRQVLQGLPWNLSWHLIWPISGRILQKRRHDGFLCRGLTITGLQRLALMGRKTRWMRRCSLFVSWRRSKGSPASLQDVGLWHVGPVYGFSLRCYGTRYGN